jgi:acetolactate synthase small subunit
MESRFHPGLFVLREVDQLKNGERTICVWAEDKCGVLARVVGIIAAKGANIERLIVSADRPGRSRILIVTTLEPRLQERVVREISRLVNVFRAVDVTGQYLDN